MWIWGWFKVYDYVFFVYGKNCFFVLFLKNGILKIYLYLIELGGIIKLMCNEGWEYKFFKWDS